jgi:hypothetical protein
MCSPKEMANMTDSDPTRTTPRDEESAPGHRQEAATSPAPEDPGYLTETGQAVGEDGSVVPIIGGLPAVEGSAWDIGASVDDRGAGLANDLGAAPDQASHKDPLVRADEGDGGWVPPPGGHRSTGLPGARDRA